MRTLITGISTRAIAESAVRSGYDVVTLDYFGDRDQKELVENYSLMRDFHLSFSSSALFEASRQLAFEAVAYTSNLENHPEVVEHFARHHRVLGNPPDVLTRVRHWPTLLTTLAEAGFRVPETLYDGDGRRVDPTQTWLRKPARTGGGHGIAFWRNATSAGSGAGPIWSLGPDFMLQEYVPGVACSASLVANGRECVVVGLTEQLIGRPEFSAHGFRYCGNLLPLDSVRNPADGLPVLDQVQRIAALVTREFGLVGVNGIDFVLNDGQVCLTEVNPRYSASMELVERAYGLPMFDLHARAVLHSELPEFDLANWLADGPFHGKAILYAERDAIAPDTNDWLDHGIRDVPFPGDSLAQGGPICTVLACEPTRDACFARLVAQAEALKGKIYA
jgi:predicted ATP-grasp superfamily ATP-dependent carboligase